jgi:hypothetical protein
MREVPHHTAPRIYTQKEINALFTRYNLSCSDPNTIAVTISTHWLLYKHGVYGSESVREFTLSGVETLYYIMVQISKSQNHRHRVDAKNIAEECRHRISETGPDNLLKPCPMPKPYKRGKISSKSYPQLTESGKTDAGEQGESVKSKEQITAFSIAPPDPLEPDASTPVTAEKPTSLTWGISGRLPRPWITPRIKSARHRPLPKLAPENRGIKRVIRDLIEDKETGNMMLKEIETTRSSKKYNPRLYPKLYCDDPGELCLKLPEDCQFIVHPTPEIDRSITERMNWEPLVVYDLRTCLVEAYTSPLRPNSYIWKLCDMIRGNLLNPDVTRSFVIIARAHPSRYAESSKDNIEDEPPPTVEESRIPSLPHHLSNLVADHVRMRFSRVYDEVYRVGIPFAGHCKP